MCDIKSKVEIIRKHLKSYPDFPRPGILFWDIFSVLQNPEVFAILKDVLVHTAKNIQPPVECVVALDARGFLFGPLIALALQIPFVPIRKKGKLPGAVTSVTYDLEYGQDTFQIQRDSLKPGQKVLLVDDLLATGGTLKAGVSLVKEIGGEVTACLVVVELPALKGREAVAAKIVSLISL